MMDVHKRRLFSLLVLFVVFSALSAHAIADNRSLPVYIASGSASAYRYHLSAECPNLSRSTVAEVTIEYAASNGFTPCSRCHPPAPDFTVVATQRPVAESNGEGTGPYTSSTKPEQTYTSSPVIPNASKRFSMAGRSGGTKTSGETWIVPCFLLCVTVGTGAFFAIRGVIADKREKSERERREKTDRENWEKERLKYAELYAGKSSLELSGAPIDCYVGEDGLPASRSGNEKWGDEYTVYMTVSGRAYHKKNCSITVHSNAAAVNAYRAKTGFRRYQGKHYFYACSFCRPVLPDMAWYEKYLIIKATREKYGILESCLKRSDESFYSFRATTNPP